MRTFYVVIFSLLALLTYVFVSPVVTGGPKKSTRDSPSLGPAVNNAQRESVGGEDGSSPEIVTDKALLKRFQSYFGKSVRYAFVNTTQREDCDPTNHPTIAVELSGHVRLFETTSKALKENLLSRNPCAYVMAMSYDVRGNRRSVMQESNPSIFTRDTYSTRDFLKAYSPYLRTWVMRHQDQALEEIADIVRRPTTQWVRPFRYYQWRIVEQTHNLTLLDFGKLTWDYCARARFDTYFFRPLTVSLQGGLLAAGPDKRRTFACARDKLVRMVEKARTWTSTERYRREHSSDHFIFGPTVLMTPALRMFSYFSMHPNIEDYASSFSARRKVPVFHTEVMTDRYLEKVCRADWCTFPPLGVLLRSTEVSVKEQRLGQQPGNKETWHAFLRTAVTTTEIEALMNLTV